MHSPSPGALPGDCRQRTMGRSEAEAMIDPKPAGTGSVATRPAAIDCDVHCEVPNVEALFPYLPAYWVEHIQQTLFKGPVASYYPSRTAGGGAEGRLPPETPKASSLKVVQDELLDPTGAELAILNCLYAVDSLNNPDAAVALSSAVNDWLINEWL